MRINFSFKLEKNPTSTSQQKGVNYRTGKVFTKSSVARLRYEYAAKIKNACQLGVFWLPEPLKGPLSVRLRFGFETKNKKLLGGMKDTKPDIDNVAKLLIDALADCGFFEVGDQQISHLEVSKWWTEKPCVEITIEDYGGE